MSITQVVDFYDLKECKSNSRQTIWREKNYILNFKYSRKDIDNYTCEEYYFATVMIIIILI